MTVNTSPERDKGPDPAALATAEKGRAALATADVGREEAPSDLADRILNRKMKHNRQLDIEQVQFATDPELRVDPRFDARKKLVMAEVLKLVADSLDPARSSNLALDEMVKRKRTLRKAIRIARRQMLDHLRPRERLVHQLMLWKANSRNAGTTTMHPGEASLFLGPNHLVRQAFQKVVRHEVRQSNGKIARKLYRSFLFLPAEQLAGGASSLVPYLRMGQELHFHVMGGIRIADTLDELGRVRDEWRLRLSDVGPAEQEALAAGSLVANEIVLRPPDPECGETEPLTCPLHYAQGAQMTRYFQRKKEGDWFLPVLHPLTKAADLRTVNMVSGTRDQQHDYVRNGFNFAYVVLPSEDEDNPGVKFYGGVTTFPEDQIDVEELGNQAVPMIQSQARVTRNRIYFYLVTQMERYVGGQYDETEVREAVQKYLENMKLQHQIEGFDVIKCKKDGTGGFRIQVSVEWSANARKFEIDLNESAVDKTAT